MEILKELFKINEINRILRKYLKETKSLSDFNKVSFESYAIERLADGIGYLGDHFLLNIKFKWQEKIEEISFFVKVSTASQKEYLEEIFVFQKETNLYRKVLSKFKVDAVVPRYYKTESEKIIVLENLMILKYKLFANEESILDFDHLMAALKSLATLHAASVNFEHENRKSLIELFPEYFKENSFIENQNGLRKYRLENAIKVFQICLPEIEELKCCKNPKKIVDEWPSLMRQIYEFIKPSQQYRNVFLHGDLWRNNLLFKYDDNGM